MAGTIYSIRAEVRISAPFNEAFTPEGETFLEAYDDRGEQTMFGRDIVSITVTNSIRSPSGRFNIEVVPRPVLGDKEWVDIIKPYSLVSIAFQRIGPADDPSTDQAPVPIMLGIVDKVERMDDYATAQHRRSQRIMGRSLMAAVEDHKYWFHHLLSKEGVLPADYREFLPPASRNTDFRDEVAVRGLGLLAVNEDLFAQSERTPIALAATGYDFFVRGTPDRPPFIKLFFSDGTQLQDRMKFDVSKAESSYVDKRAALITSQLPTELKNGSLFDIVRVVAGPPDYVEVFSETVGETVRDSQVELIIRKPPWAGHIDYDVNDRVGLRFATNGGAQPQMRGQTLFEDGFGGWDLARDTVRINHSDVVATMSLGRGVEGKEGVFTLYQIQPKARAMDIGNGQGNRTWKQLIPPIVEDSPDSPSFIKRFGVRPFDKPVTTIPIGDDNPESKGVDFVRRCLAYAALAREWFYRKPEFWEGTYVVKGRTSLRAGKRLFDENLSREYYITSVAHRMSFGDEPSYLTTVQVARGWDIETGAV